MLKQTCLPSGVIAATEMPPVRLYGAALISVLLYLSAGPGGALVGIAMTADSAEQAGGSCCTRMAGTLAFELSDSFATHLGWLMPWSTPLTLLADSPGKIAAAQARRD